MVAKFKIIGRATKDTEMVELPNGTQKASITLATNDANASYFFNLIAFDKKATLCNEYVKKGKQIYVEGNIKPRTYEKDGEKKYITDYIIQVVEFLGGSSQNNNDKDDEMPF